MKHRLTKSVLLMVSLCIALPPVVGQETGEAVRIAGVVAEDVYAAGGTVDVVAAVEGDVVAAGGRIAVSNRVSGDVMAAGGSVSVRADVGDDVRLAGGDVTLAGAVGDDAIAAGGNVTLAPDGTVGGRAWFSGGRIDIGGTVGGELRGNGGRILISGHVHGDVHLNGRDISILDSAIVDGKLVYRSPRPAQIASAAQIRGGVTYEPVEQPVMAVAAAVAGAGIVALLSLIVTGVALFLLFSGFILTSVATIRGEFWKSLGLGLAVVAATPVVISLLFATVIGWLPAFVVGALYLLLLLAGWLTGVFFVGGLGRRLFGRGEMSRAGWLWSFVAALVLLVLLGLVPVLGQLLLFVVTLIGVGALMLGIYRAYAKQ